MGSWHNGTERCANPPGKAGRTSRGYSAHCVVHFETRALPEEHSRISCVHLGTPQRHPSCHCVNSCTSPGCWLLPPRAGGLPQAPAQKGAACSAPCSKRYQLAPGVPSTIGGTIRRPTIKGKDLFRMCAEGER